MEEKKYMDLKTDSNDLNIDASIETNEIQINIPKNKVKKKIIIILIISLLIEILAGGLLIYFYLSQSNDSSDSDSINSLDCTYCINSLISSDSSDSEIKSFEEKNIEKEKVEEKIKIAKYNTIIKLNDLNFSSFNSNHIYNKEYLNSFYNFTMNFFKIINYIDYSPITLYSVLINLYMSISDKDELKKLNEILGLNHDERLLFYNQIFKNNYFSNSDGETKISNGAFYNSDNAKENETFIKEINKTYTECYKLSYEKDFNFILDWIDNTVKEKDFLNKSYFENTNGINLLLISSFYYNQKWSEKFIDSMTYKDKFYINNKDYIEVDFMRHSYSVDYYYDYGTYISFYDFYSNQYSIQYLIPKSISKNLNVIKNNYNSNILNLIKDKNFLEEDENNKINISIINLSVPKFTKKN